jgi:signal transduction histidine kinase
MSIPLCVLIVEDSEDDTILLVRELRSGDYDVKFERVDSAAAMKAAVDEAQWNIVLCDYSMPHFSGKEALQLLRDAGSDVPFIFVSGTIGEEAAVAALKEGAQDYVMKDNLKRLLPAVNRELQEFEERKERKRLERYVQQLEKFESIGRLAGGVAHDFNNALNVILGWTQLAYERTAEDDRVRQQLQKIRDQAQRAAGLTSKLLAFARKQVLLPRNLNLNKLVTDTAGLLSSVLGEHIELLVTLAPDLSLTLADPAQIEQVVMNLCLNARDAMPTGGCLRIKTQDIAVGQEFCRVHPYASSGNFVLLTVSDTGVGMDAATKDRIFEPFFTTKGVGRGTGLGLATVYGIVKQHGGFVTVDTQPGRGTTFRVYLPVAWGVIDATEAGPVDQLLAGTETILVAEDNDAVREMVHEVLAAHGYKVILATNGQEAVRLFTSRVNEIQLVLLDVVMPGLTGPIACSQIRAIKPQVPVILTTGHTTETASLEGLCAGEGIGFLQKPYIPSALRRTVRDMLNHAYQHPAA